MRMKYSCLSFFRLPKIVLFILLFNLFRLGYGQEIASKIDQKDLKDFIKTLSSIQFEGRAVDNDGQIKTQHFIVDRFKTLQIEPFYHDGYLENFTLKQTDKTEVFLKTQNHQILKNFDRMMFTDDIPPIKVIESQVVFGGYATEDELNQIEVENRLVLVLSVNPSELFPITKRLEARKAAGLIVFHDDDKPFEATKSYFNEVHFKKKYAIADGHEPNVFDSYPSETHFLNAFIIPEAEVINVMGWPKNKLVSLANRKKIKMAPPANIEIHFEQVEKTIETANVVGGIRGESEQVIILSAHYDHVGVDGNVYYPGADDNASGVAALLELAEEFVQCDQLKYSMIFLATSAEEGGLLGSSYHVNNPEFDADKVVCNINMDMISRCDNKQSDCNYLYCIGNNLTETLDSLIREADNRVLGCMCDYSENNTGIFARTDGANFSKKGIPSILFFTGFHDDYHKPTDTMEKIDFDLLENRILLISEVIKLIQRTPNPIRKPINTTIPE